MSTQALTAPATGTMTVSAGDARDLQPVETTPGSKTRLRFSNSNQARDAIDAAMDKGELDLPGWRNVLFRYCCEHAWYKHSNEGLLGTVNDRDTGYKRIAKRLGASEKTMKRAAKDLEDDGLIEREHRHYIVGGSDPDFIRVTWLMEASTDYGDLPEEDSVSLSDEDTLSPSDEDTESLSSSTEELSKNSSTRADGEATPDGENPKTKTQGRSISPQGDRDEIDLDNREYLAQALGFPAEQAGRVGWNVVRLAEVLIEEYGLQIVVWACHACRDADNPAAYFVTAAESICAQLAADSEARAEEDRAAAEQSRLAAEDELLATEVESHRARFAADFGWTDSKFDMHVRLWQREEKTNAEIILRLQKLQEKYEREQQKLARQRQANEAELEQILPELAALKYDGDVDRARDDFMGLWNDGSDPDLRCRLDYAACSLDRARLRNERN